jgi:hypothetical protein
MTEAEFSRRQVLLALGASGLAATTVGVGPAAAQTEPPSSPPGVWSGPTSANGWPVLDRAAWVDIEGSGQRVRLAGGSATAILGYVARRFHYEIDELRDDDLQGYLPSLDVGQAYESNHLSGTALAIRPHAYPAGVSGGFYPAELVVIHDILTELDGVVAWGGDFTVPKESHFEIAHRSGDRRVTRMADRITSWRRSPGGTGPGAIDAFRPERIEGAEAFVQAHD